MTTLWILGAPDPEMERIAGLLVQCGERVAYAACRGERCRSSTAYQADGLLGGDDVPAGVRCVLVECVGSLAAASIAARVDHHRLGDSGYGRPPAEFMAASSIGQVIERLAQAEALPIDWRRTPAGDGDGRPGVMTYGHGRTPWVRVLAAGWWCVVPDDLVLCAAADHCLAAAYRGECPGVDPEALMRWRAESRAARRGLDVEAVLADVRAAIRALRDAPALVVGTGITARDMRRRTPVPELPEAAARIDESFVSGPLIGPGGRAKYTCHGRPEVISAWLAQWAPAHELSDLYGDPARGFAGGYASPF